MTKCVQKECGKTITTIGYTRSKYPKGTTPSRTSYATALCQTCRNDIYKFGRKQLIVSCTICKTSIYVKQRMGGVRMTCSEECAKKRMSLLSKERYRKANPIKINICSTCNRSFLGNNKYCSRQCYPTIGRTWFKIKKFKQLKKELKSIGYKI